MRTFLAMARQQPPQRGPVAIEEVVAAALDIANYALRSANIDVQIDLADDLPPIDADADQLHQVLLNLLINAAPCAAGRGRAAPRAHHRAPRACRLAPAADRGRQRAGHSRSAAGARVRALPPSRPAWAPASGWP